MRKKPERLLPAALLVMALLPAALAAQKAAQPPARPKRLVRVDLLTPPPAESRPVRRDVFSPGSESAPLAGIGYAAISSPSGLPDSPGSPGSSRPGTQGAPAAAEAGAAGPTPPTSGGEAPVYIPSVRYIGYVDFGRKLTALVIADGQPLAVEEKDELLPGYRVVTITAERIELADPNGTKRSYLREGEQP